MIALMRIIRIFAKVKQRSLVSIASMHFAIINGPNLANLGHREPEVYGVRSMEQLLAELVDRYPALELSYKQSHCEGGIIEALYEAEARGVQGIVLNAGAYTHTSIAILDAIRAITIPVVEVHISNIHAREAYRHQSLIASACIGIITGFGLDSYRLAIEALTNRMND